jgi:hypothetical protein
VIARKTPYRSISKGKTPNVVRIKKLNNTMSWKVNPLFDFEMIFIDPK